MKITQTSKNIKDAALKEVARLRRLKTLNLTATKVIDMCVDELKKLLPDCTIVSLILPVKLLKRIGVSPKGLDG